MQLCISLSILWHCLSLGLEWKLTFSSPVATAEFSKFAGILSVALSQHHLPGFEIAQLEFHQWCFLRPTWLHIPGCLYHSTLWKEENQDPWIYSSTSNIYPLRHLNWNTRGNRCGEKRISVHAHASRASALAEKRILTLVDIKVHVISLKHIDMFLKTYKLSHQCHFMWISLEWNQIVSSVQFYFDLFWVYYSEFLVLNMPWKE